VRVGIYMSRSPRRLILRQERFDVSVPAVRHIRVRLTLNSPNKSHSCSSIPGN
jgi:hypothetical protein